MDNKEREIRENSYIGKIFKECKMGRSHIDELLARHLNISGGVPLNMVEHHLNILCRKFHIFQKILDIYNFDKLKLYSRRSNFYSLVTFMLGIFNAYIPLSETMDIEQGFYIEVSYGKDNNISPVCPERNIIIQIVDDRPLSVKYSVVFIMDLSSLDNTHMYVCEKVLYEQDKYYNDGHDVKREKVLLTNHLMKNNIRNLSLLFKSGENIYEMDDLRSITMGCQRVLSSDNYNVEKEEVFYDVIDNDNILFSYITDENEVYYLDNKLRVLDSNGNIIKEKIDDKIAWYKQIEREDV